MLTNQVAKIRYIQLAQTKIICYFFNYFKSPGLSEYPLLSWVNSDYDLIKSSVINPADVKRIATNFWKTGEHYQLFNQVDFFIMMPLKQKSVSQLPIVIEALIQIIKIKNHREIKFIDDLFVVSDYQKFWENRLSLQARKKVIDNKIKLKEKYFNYFKGKQIVLIDDIIATGTSLINIGNLISNYNSDVKISMLCYGSVYKWEELYC